MQGINSILFFVKIQGVWQASILRGALNDFKGRGGADRWNKSAEIFGAHDVAIGVTSVKIV
jgi:hypothetical protein